MRVPLVLVTGFLGAGKTTLVNALLASRAARGASGKIGVIVNELGAVGIDGALLGSDATRQVELPGGCVCCVLGPELDQTLLELVGANPEMEAIVLETTGVAEPLPIAWALDRAPLSERVRLAIVVTLVDASNFRASRDLSVSVGTQVAHADVLLVTKEAIAGETETRQVLAAIHELAPKALVRRGSTAEHAQWLEEALADPPVSTPIAAGKPASPAHSHAHEGHEHDGDCRDADTHAHGVDSTSLEVEGPVDVEELEDQLGELPANYVRIKGIVRSGDGSWVAIHRVGLRVSIDPLPRKPDGFASESGMIVALGSDLSSEKLAQCLDAAYLGD